MGYITNELFDRIGSITKDGYILDAMHHRIAWINDDGYIYNSSHNDICGKIDEDGTLRDSASNVVGRIEADGYIYIFSNRVGKLSSSFIERITPLAWNAGQVSSYKGRNTSSKDKETSSSFDGSFFLSGFFVKVVFGVVLGVVLWSKGIGGAENIIAGPILVFMFSLLRKIFG